MAYKAHEYNRETLEPTGKVLVFLSPSREEAVDSLLYYVWLSNGAAFKHNYSVFSGAMGYSIPENK